MKINFVAVQKVDGKLWATARNEDASYDFAMVVKSIRSLHALHIFKSRKEAEDTAAFWNECYEKNGTLMTWDEIGRYAMARLI